MGMIGWTIFGLVVGIVAKFLMPERDPGGSLYHERRRSDGPDADASTPTFCCYSIRLALTRSRPQTPCILSAMTDDAAPRRLGRPWHTTGGHLRMVVAAGADLRTAQLAGTLTDAPVSCVTFPPSRRPKPLGRRRHERHLSAARLSPKADPAAKLLRRDRAAAVLARCEAEGAPDASEQPLS